MNVFHITMLWFWPFMNKIEQYLLFLFPPSCFEMNLRPFLKWENVLEILVIRRLREINCRVFIALSSILSMEYLVLFARMISYKLRKIYELFVGHPIRNEKKANIFPLARSFWNQSLLTLYLTVLTLRKERHTF